MILGLLRRNPRGATIAAFHERIAAASRQPGLYEALCVPDTVEGRFESLVLHMLLVLRRLRRLPPPAEDVAQDLVDCVFRHLDVSIREAGVGDVGVPKRMKKLAGAFYARMATYDPALETGDAAMLTGQLAKGLEAEPQRGLTDYLLAAERGLAASDLDRLLGEGPRFPDPASFRSP